MKIVQEGALPHLIGLLRSSHDSVLIQAAGSVRNLSVGHPSPNKIDRLAGPCSILHTLTVAPVVEQVHPQNEFKIVQEGGIKPMVDLLRSPNYKVVEQVQDTPFSQCPPS